MAKCIKCGKSLPDGAIFCPMCGKRQTSEPRKRRKRANGSGTIYKMSGKRTKPWAAARNGVYIGAFTTYAEAQKALERTTDNHITDRYNMTFAEIYDLWKPEHARTVSTSQMACYASAYKNAASLHDRMFRTLRKSDFQNVIIHLENIGKSKSTCEKVLQLFGQLSKWAIDEGIVQADLSANVTTTAKQKTERKPFSAADVEAMKASALPAAKIALILISTGCRPTELFSVPIGNCTDRYFIGGSKTSAGRNRVIAISPEGLEAYRQLLQNARESGGKRLIDGYAGNHDTANFAKRDFRALMEEIGCEGMTPYNCRHTYITNAVRSGVKPELLERLVGHASFATTDKHYTHLDVNDLLHAAGMIRTDFTVTSKLSANEEDANSNVPKKLAK